MNDNPAPSHDRLPAPFPDPVRWWAERQPDRPAVLSDTAVVSYADLDAGVDAAVTSLAASGVGAGDPVEVAVGRDLVSVTWLWAVWRLGAVAVVTDPDARSPIPGSWGVRRLPVSPHGSAEQPAAQPAERPAAQPVERPVAAAQPVERPVAAGQPSLQTAGAAPAGQITVSTPHTWVPTSGSGGTPRAVVLTHGNVAAAVAASQARLGNGPDDRWLAVLPLFHVGGLSVLWRSAAAGGAVVLHDTFDAGRVAGVLADGSVTFASLVPTMLRRIVATGVTPAARLRAVLVGGAAADPTLIGAALDAGFPVLATYGATEACSQIATVVPGEERVGVDGVGLPLDGMEVAIVDPQGAAVTPGEVGEIVVSGPAVSPGYVGEPPRTGPHHTGDLGRRDGGRLIVVGRRDDVIVTGGENVDPAAVEAEVCRHPGVVACVVYGEPDPEWGQVVSAVVEVADGAAGVTVAALDDHVRVNLSPAQRPRRWRRVDRLPLLPNGKIDRAAAAEPR